MSVNSRHEDAERNMNSSIDRSAVSKAYRRFLAAHCKLSNKSHRRRCTHNSKHGIFFNQIINVLCVFFLNGGGGSSLLKQPSSRL
jgi:hypothetical protein